MDIHWPALIIGVIAIAIGIAVIAARERLAASIAEGQRGMFGKAGDKIANQSKPSGVLIAGIGAIVIGAVAIFVAITAPDAF